jgi:hypothetical protein
MFDWDMLRPEELERLQEKEYSRYTFALSGFALLETDPHKIRPRYWVQPKFGGKYYACSQWRLQDMNKHESCFESWIRKIARENGIPVTPSEPPTGYTFEDCSKNVEKEIAIALGKVCHHIHPEIIEKIREENRKFKDEFKEICEGWVDTFLYDGSDCVFPGVRRCINSEKTGNWKNNINPKDYTILNDNTFPRHIWAFLSMNKAYSGGQNGIWDRSGLSKFELAHIFGHKENEKELERKVFKNFYSNKMPYALFTSAANVVLIPNGLMKPTDKFESIKIAFYKRHIDLYGENFYAESSFREEFVPKWYEEIKWLEPVLPEGWEGRINNLLKYRRKFLKNKYGNKILPPDSDEV